MQGGGAGGDDDSELVTTSNGRLVFRHTATSNLVEMNFVGDALVVNADDAAFLVDTFEMLARSRLKIGFLVDCTGLANTEPAWRARLADYFRSEAPLVGHVAWYHTTINLAVTVEMFVVATPDVVGKRFASEADARAWLASQGIR